MDACVHQKLFAGEFYLKTGARLKRPRSEESLKQSDRYQRTQILSATVEDLSIYSLRSICNLTFGFWLFLPAGIRNLPVEKVNVEAAPLERSLSEKTSPCSPCLRGASLS